MCGALFFSLSTFLITPTYEAQTQLYVNNLSNSGGSVTVGELTAAQNLIDTYVVILNSRNTLTDIIRTAEVDYTPAQLEKMITAGSVNNTEVLYVTVTSENPSEAAKIAGVIAELLPTRIAEVVQGSSVYSLELPEQPTKPSAPNISRYTAIGALIGLLLSCVIVVVVELRDNKIRDEDFLTQTYDIPVLSAIPELLEKEKQL